MNAFTSLKHDVPSFVERFQSDSILGVQWLQSHGNDGFVEDPAGPETTAGVL